MTRMLIPALKLLLALLIVFGVFLPCFYSFSNVYRPKTTHPWNTCG